MSTTLPTTTLTKGVTTKFSTKLRSTTIFRTIPAEQRLLFTHKPWVYYNFTGFQRHSSTGRSFIRTTTNEGKLSAALKTTMPLPTPWYSPAGPFDWWQWQWYTTKYRKLSSHNTLTTTTTTTARTTRTTTSTTSITYRTTTVAHVTNKSNSHNKVILDRFVWPDQLLSSTNTDRSNDFEKEYQDWLEYLTTNGIQEILTSTTLSSTSTPIVTREEYPQINSLSTKPSWRLVTVDTPPSKRQHQSNSLSSDRNAISMQPNGMICLIKK